VLQNVPSNFFKPNGHKKQDFWPLKSRAKTKPEGTICIILLALSGPAFKIRSSGFLFAPYDVQYRIFARRLLGLFKLVEIEWLLRETKAGKRGCKDTNVKIANVKIANYCNLMSLFRMRKL
jgi:hypothetical protein